MIRVVVADDHPMARERLVTLLAAEPPAAPAVDAPPPNMKPRIPFPQLRLFATVLPFARPFIFALDVPGLADVGES